MSEPQPDPLSDKAAPLNPETARIVLRLDDAISSFRAGEATGIRALDSASRLIGDLADDALTSNATRRGERGRIPRRPEAEVYRFVFCLETKQRALIEKRSRFVQPAC